MSDVLRYEKFNGHDLGDDKSPLRKKFNEIIKDLEENNGTSQGDIKLIKGDGNIEYLRAKLSDGDRLLFTSVKHNDKDVFVMLEVILNHDYQKSKFLKDKEKIKNIKITDQNSKEVSKTVEIKDTPQVHWLGKFITLSAKQEDIIENAKLPLIVNGAAGSGKTSVALEKLRKIEEKFEEGKVLYITQSENLIKQSKELYEYVYWDETADEFKIGIPDRIEFLSLHEFLEKRVEDIKGKKPIDRSKFFSWFNEICKKDKFKECKKDGDKIFEEFTAVIAGGNLKKEQYKELGKRQAIFSEEKRDRVYSLFEEYKEFIEKDSEYYDPNLIAHECTEEKVYDAVVVDEVQDLTESTLNLILKSLKDESKANFLLCGDVNQVIHPSFFSLSKLKSFLHKNTPDKELSVYVLEKNYRNSEQVIELANRVLHLKNYCFASEDKMTKGEVFFMSSDTKNTGNVSFIADDKKKEIAEKVSNSTNWAVLVLDDESKKDAHELFNTPLVFNIHEAKGLEYKNVILYEFMSCKAYNGMWNIAKDKTGETKIEEAIGKVRDSYDETIKDEENLNTSRSKNKEDKSFEEYKFYINALYVGVSRAIDSVYIIGNEKKYNLLKVIKLEGVSDIDIKKDVKKEESTPEDWRDMALKLIDEKKIEQAKNIVKTKLLNTKYAKESTKKLETQGYHVEAQGSNKNKQATSELKTENRASQGSSINKSKVSAEKSEKHKDRKLQNKNHPNEKKKLTKRELEENTKKLFLALKNGNLQLAEKLIEQGVNVNAKAEKGLTLLHFVAHKGHKDIAELLLHHKEINVNVKAEEDLTPLHLAARRGHSYIAALLLKHEKIDVNAKNNESATPLHLAVHENRIDSVELLLQHGAKINAKVKDDCTSLHFAAQKGLYGVVKILLDNGAEVDIRNSKGDIPLHLAILYEHYNVVKLFLDRGANVNVRSKKIGYTLLHGAARSNNDSIAELLLSRGSDVKARDAHGYTPLHIAAERGRDRVVKLFLSRGAKVNAKNRDDQTPLTLALEKGNSEIVDLLLADQNINVDCVDLKRITGKEAEKRKLVIKRIQDNRLFDKVKEAANEKDMGKLNELLTKIKDLLKPENEYGFKPSLNYSPDSNDENTTIKIACEAGGKLLQILYDYTEKNIGTDTEIFKQLKQAIEQEKPQPQLYSSTVSRSSNPGLSM